MFLSSIHTQTDKTMSNKVSNETSAHCTILCVCGRVSITWVLMPVLAIFLISQFSHGRINCCSSSDLNMSVLQEFLKWLPWLKLRIILFIRITFGSDIWKLIKIYLTHSVWDCESHAKCLTFSLSPESHLVACGK